MRLNLLIEFVVVCLFVCLFVLSSLVRYIVSLVVDALSQFQINQVNFRSVDLGSSPHVSFDESIFQYMAGPNKTVRAKVEKTVRNELVVLKKRKFDEPESEADPWTTFKVDNGLAPVSIIPAKSHQGSRRS